MARMGLMVNPTSGKNTGAQVGTEALTLLRAAGVDILDLSAADARSAMEQCRAAIASALRRPSSGPELTYTPSPLVATTPFVTAMVGLFTPIDAALMLAKLELVVPASWFSGVDVP